MALWDSLSPAERQADLTLTPAQAAELDRRWVEHLQSRFWRFLERCSAKVAGLSFATRGAVSTGAEADGADMHNLV